MTTAPAPALSQPAYMADEPDDAVRQMLAGNSPAIRHVRAMIRMVAPSDASVLISGPTGSGKEVVARAIHAGSNRAHRPFIAVNCGAIPSELIESELFGHERGAFTGAHDRRIGRFEQAAGGTLLLDEIGDMPVAAQVRLLRVLEHKCFSRIGGRQEVPFTGRIIAASHCDLPRRIEEGSFRSDLWYRLAVAIITLPSLDQRREDIPDLVEQLSRGIDRPARLSDTALSMLARHDWPGNVRELRSVLVRAALFHPPGLGPVDVRHLPSLISPAGSAPAAGPLLKPVEDDGLSGLIAALERRQMCDALRRANGIVANAARMTGINRTTFIEKMRRHGLTRAEAIEPATHNRRDEDKENTPNQISPKSPEILPLLAERRAREARVPPDPH
ncbi:sigma-54 interaction domain-containing protein [Sphingomonas lacunae]|nr:sigma-54 dependent transcriptional regulator [Sphingomonas lacunae]